MDRVIDRWVTDGLLLPYPQLCIAFPVFIIPKADGTIRPIIDFSPWTPYIQTPRFSLLGAAKVIRYIPQGSHMVKVDLKSGFHQLPVNPRHYRFNGVYYRGQKYALTCLPMGHALAPGVFQRFAERVLRAVTRRANVNSCAYLDDWLLWGTAEDLDHAITIIRALGVTINEAKSTLNPTKQLTYLGFRVNSDRLTIKMLLNTHDRPRCDTPDGAQRRTARGYMASHRGCCTT